MGGRRVAHTRGKVLGGSSSINGMIFQRGNPLDYERWAAEPGHGATGTTPTACRTSRRWRTASPAPTTTAAMRGPLVLERGSATNPLFGAFFEAAQQAGYTLTDDVNGFRQEGFARFDQNLHRGRRLSAATRLPPPRDRPAEPRRRDPGERDGRALSRAAGHRCRVPHAGAASGARSTAGEVILCGGAFNSPQLLQVSGVGDGDHLRQRRCARSSTTCPASAPTCRITSRCTSSTRRASRCRSTRCSPGTGDRGSGCSGSSGSGPGTTNHFEAGGFVRSNDDVAYPNLMFHFLPIAVRYDGSRPPAPHGYQVHVGPMYSDVRGSVRITSPDARVKPALRFNYLSTPNDRREWVEAIHVARHILGQPAFAPFDGGEVSPGPGVDHRRGDPRLGRRTTPRRPSTRRARARWGPASCRSSIRTRCASTASTGCGSSTPR